MAESSAGKQPRRGAGKPFEAGKSGNPRGKPVGARNKVSLAIETLLDGESEAITRKCIDMAKDGDGLAMRLVMERIAPLRRGRPVRFDMPPLDGPGGLVKGLGGILQAVASGALTPEEGGTVAGIMDAQRRAHETVERTRSTDGEVRPMNGLERRLVALERRECSGRQTYVVSVPYTASDPADAEWREQHISPAALAAAAVSPNALVIVRHWYGTPSDAPPPRVEAI
jgi:hypothetical protein